MSRTCRTCAHHDPTRFSGRVWGACLDPAKRVLDTAGSAVHIGPAVRSSWSCTQYQPVLGNPEISQESEA
jgi:hypothetical protein